jgi:hypothetical protein
VIQHPRKRSDNPLQYERGQELLSLTAVPGWDVVLDLLKEDIDGDEKKFLAGRYSDPNELYRAHSELQGKKKLLTRLEANVKFLIELVQNPPEAIQKYTPF